VRIIGDVGAAYRIQASENSVKWADVGTISVTSETGVEFIDTSGATNHRFYRAVLN
jgi:hypothetical protein